MFNNLYIYNFIITHLTNGTSPWNITISSNPLYFPNIIIQNMPYFFPLLTLMLFGVSAYLINTKVNLATKTNLLSVALSYTVLTYIEVAGGLTTIGWFVVFEIIVIAILYAITLFIPVGE